MPFVLPPFDAPARVTHRNLPGFSADAVASAFRPLMPRHELDAAVGAYGAVHRRALEALGDARPPVDPKREDIWERKLASHPLRDQLLPLLATPGVVTDYLHAFAPPWSLDAGRISFPGLRSDHAPVLVDTPARQHLLATALANPFQPMAGVSVFGEDGGHLGSLLTGTQQTPDDVVEAASVLHSRLGPQASLLVPFYHTPYLGKNLVNPSNTLWRSITDRLARTKNPLTVHDILRSSPTRFFSQAKGVEGRVDDDFDRLDDISRRVASSLTGPNSSRAAGLSSRGWEGAFPVSADAPIKLYQDLASGADLVSAEDLLVTPPASDVAIRERMGDALSSRGLQLLPLSDI